MRCWLFVILTLSIFKLQAENESDSLYSDKSKTTLFAYFDVFYAYDFNRPQTPIRQPFFFNHNRHHSININHALIRGSYSSQRVRARLGFHSGTYVQDNYASENTLQSFLYEANVSLALDKHEKFWFAAGIMESHLGFEGTIAPNNHTLTRSMCAENSPYYNSGASMTYQPKATWKFQALALNGWQSIRRVQGNNFLSYGTRINYASEKMELNWSTFLGTNDPDSTRRMRYFSNLYAVYSWKNNFTLTFGFDYGLQQKEKGSETYHHWYNFTAIGKMALSDKLNAAFRVEYFKDYNLVVMQSFNGQPFEVYGSSLNFDYQVNQNLLFRIESRLLVSPNELFIKNDLPQKNNVHVVGSMIFRIGQ